MKQFDDAATNYLNRGSTGPAYAASSSATPRATAPLLCRFHCLLPKSHYRSFGSITETACSNEPPAFSADGIALVTEH